MRRVYEPPVKRLDKLSKNQKEDLLADLLAAFQIVRDPTEVVLFVQDLFSRSEVAHLAKRLRIAKLLLNGKTYEEIEKDIHTSHATVAKVAEWLTRKGDGFRRVIAKLPEEQRKDTSLVAQEWNRLKRRYPRYFWPEILLEEIVKMADTRQKERLRGLLSTLKEKSNFHKQLETILSQSYKKRRV